MVIGVCHSSVLHLLEKLVGGVLIAVLLHLRQVALLRGDCCIHLQKQRDVLHTRYGIVLVHQGFIVIPRRA